MKTCSLRERQLLKALNDPEMVAIMIGDVKLSVPGLQAAKANKKAKNKAKGSSKGANEGEKPKSKQPTKKGSAKK
jgi:hypothetical protein